MNRQDLLSHKNELTDKGHIFFTEKAMTIDREQMLMIVAESIDYVVGRRVIELGYTDRGWTDALRAKGVDLTVIEGSGVAVVYAKKKYADTLDIKHMLFEEYVPDKPVDTVVMSCILEHVLDPVSLLKKIKEWLSPDGRLVIIVPNKYSLHRRIGHSLKMIKTYEELSPNDIEVGHQRHYDVDLMLDHLVSAGFAGRFEKGIFLKPLSSDKMMNWDRELLWAFNKFGRLLPEWSAFLLFTARI